MSTAISIEHIRKAYRLGEIGGRTLGSDISRWWARVRGRPDPFSKIGQDPKTRRIGQTFWALNDVSFVVPEGQVFGVIGRNGAGKSTLLKILAQVTSPTAGRVLIHGRVASLLEVGTGFHPELTGRENVFLNGAIMGMTKAEIRARFDEIVDFSECEEFIDTPVKRYSSGMYVRLAFAVAAHLEPEVLIVDEVLAVGDAQFQSKCIGKMGEVSRGGRTVLFVSHNMGSIRRLCHDAVVLDGGAVAMVGSAETAVARYLGLSQGESIWQRKVSPPSHIPVFFVDASLTNRSGTPSVAVACTESFDINITVAVSRRTPPMQIPLRITNREGIPVLTTSNIDEETKLMSLAPGRHRFRLTIPANFLAAGSYTVDMWAHVPRTVLFDQVEGLAFQIEDTGSVGSIIGDDRWGLVTPLLKWAHAYDPASVYEPTESSEKTVSR